MRKLLVTLLVFVVGLGAGFVFDRWLHRPIIIRAYSVDGTHLFRATPPNGFGPLKPQGAADEVCGLFDTPDNFCQIET